MPKREPTIVEGTRVPSHNGRITALVNCPYCSGRHEHSMPSANTQLLQLSTCNMGQYIVMLKGHREMKLAVALLETSQPKTNERDLHRFIQSLPFIPEKQDVYLLRVEHPFWKYRDGSPQIVLMTNVRWSVVSHSPGGWDWGCTNGGSADLALNILNQFAPPGSGGLAPVKCRHGFASQTAWSLYPRFVDEFIAAVLPDAFFAIAGSDIRAFVERYDAEPK